MIINSSKEVKFSTTAVLELKVRHEHWGQHLAELKEEVYQEINKIIEYRRDNGIPVRCIQVEKTKGMWSYVFVDSEGIIRKSLVVKYRITHRPRKPKKRFGRGRFGCKY